MGRRSRRPSADAAPPRPPSPPSLVAVVLAPPPLVQAASWTVSSGRTTPLVVAAPSGPVLAACPLAVAAGVAVGHSVAQARLRLPAARLVPPDDAATALLWEETLRALATVSPVVEAPDPAAGVAYLDARGLDGVWGDAAAVARQALCALAGEGIGARAGAGPSRLIARTLAWEMPTSGPRTLEGDVARQAVDALPIDTPVLGLPPWAALRLREVGVATAGALGRLPAAVGLRFGAEGLAAWERVTGRPESPLRPWSPPETITIARRDDDGSADALALRELVAAMGADLAGGLAARGQAAALLTLRLTCADGGRLVRSRARQPPLQASEAVTATAWDLLAALRPAAPVTEAALTAGELCVPSARQQGLWDDGRGRSNAARLETVLAAHARRYGRGGLQRLRCDPTAPDGWRWLDLESAEGSAGTGKDKGRGRGRGRGHAAGRDAVAWDVAGETERGW